MFAGEISRRLRHRKCFGQTMFVGMTGLSPVPELATSLFQLCKGSGGTSLTKAGKMFAKWSFCHTDLDLEHGIYKKNYLWCCATNLLHDSGAVSLPTAPLIKIHDHLEMLSPFSLMQELYSQSSVHPTLGNVRGLRVSLQTTRCYGRKELPDFKPPNKKYLWVWRKGNDWEINNFLLISVSSYRNQLMKGVSMQWAVHQWQANQMYSDCWQTKDFICSSHKFHIRKGQ